MKRGPIILTTDFGSTDEYVGVLKGVILSFNPAAQIIDLTHAIAPQDIAGAAMVIGRSSRYFPTGSIHLCIVDPGVGTGRRIIGIRTDSFYCIGPDNGVFSTVLASGEAIDVFEIRHRSWFPGRVSATFHGRDIMAPAAARLSAGEPLEDAGPRLDPASCTVIALPAPQRRGGRITGEVISIDHFGNVITSIDRSCLQTLPDTGGLGVRIKAAAIKLHHCSYGDLPAAEPAAIINSSDLLEICVKNASAADALQARIGDPVVVAALRG